MKSLQMAMLLVMITLPGMLLGQNAIGRSVRTFNDATRSGRAVTTEIYYPADMAGEDVPVAEGVFPVVVFGHGFVMEVAAYQNIWELLVPLGYIVCLPRTEGNFSPNHTEFAKDLAFLCDAMLEENGQSGSLFFQKIKPAFAVSGHSMGGGAAVLSAQYNPKITCLFTLAAANTNPSAIAAAAKVPCPSLLIAGSADCITPPAAHAAAIFEQLPVDLCQYYVSLEGASHCQFANSNFNCSFGETASGCANPPLDRATQQQRTATLILPWLAWHLKNDPLALTAFETARATIPSTDSKGSCLSTSTFEPNFARQERFKIVPNPMQQGRGARVIFLADSNEEVVHFEVLDLFGRLRHKGTAPLTERAFELPPLGIGAGVYYLQIMIGQRVRGVTPIVIL